MSMAPTECIHAGVVDCLISNAWEKIEQAQSSVPTDFKSYLDDLT